MENIKGPLGQLHPLLGTHRKGRPHAWVVFIRNLGICYFNLEIRSPLPIPRPTGGP